jgi:hypothetical protein
MVHLRRQMCRMKGVALVDGKIAAEAEMNAAVVDRDAEGPAPGPLVI